MLDYTDSAVTRNASEKKINSLLDFISASSDLDLLQVSGVLTRLCPTATQGVDAFFLITCRYEADRQCRFLEIVWETPVLSKQVIQQAGNTKQSWSISAAVGATLQQFWMQEDCGSDFSNQTLTVTSSLDLDRLRHWRCIHHPAAGVYVSPGVL